MDETRETGRRPDDHNPLGTHKLSPAQAEPSGNIRARTGIVNSSPGLIALTLLMGVELESCWIEPSQAARNCCLQSFSYETVVDTSLVPKSAELLNCRLLCNVLDTFLVVNYKTKCMIGYKLTQFEYDNVQVDLDSFPCGMEADDHTENILSDRSRCVAYTVCGKHDPVHRLLLHSLGLENAPISDSMHHLVREGTVPTCEQVAFVDGNERCLLKYSFKQGNARISLRKSRGVVGMFLFLTVDSISNVALKDTLGMIDSYIGGCP